MPIIRTPLKLFFPGVKKAGSKIYLVSLTQDGTELPFGSVAAIYDKFTRFDLGVSQQRLYDFGIEPEKPYKNKKCVIKVMEISRKKGGRGKAVIT